LCEVPNITYRNDVGEIVESNITSMIDLNESPAPNYDDFFQSMKEVWDKYKVRFRVAEVPVESSRGCLWGQKVGCTFCSLDKHSKQYRIKSGNTVIRQLDQVHKKYNKHLPSLSFMFSDRMMPSENYDDLLPKLQNRGAPYAMTYSIRPDISWRQFELCSRSGVFRLNPGIENFSTPVLRLMKKGVTGIQNIFTVFGTMYHRIVCLYNFIWGFPGEDVDEYEAMAKLLPNLNHLMPPVSDRPIMLVRYSELAEKAKNFRIKTPLHAHWRYNALFSFDFRQKNKISTNELCYRYDEEEIRQFSQESLNIYHIIQQQLINWRYRFFYKKSRLSYVINKNYITINDNRTGDSTKVYQLDDKYKCLCEIMVGKICEEEGIYHEMSKHGFNKQKVKIMLDELDELKIIIKESNKSVWIAFPEDFYKDNLAWLYDNHIAKCNLPFTKKHNA